MKVHVFSDAPLCWSLKSRSIQQLDHKIGGRMERTRICWKLKLAAPEVQFIWHVSPSASTLTWHQETNSDITEWAECRNLLAQWRRGGSICDTIQARTLGRTLVLPGACVREDVVKRTSQRTARTMGQCSTWLTYSSVTLPTRNFQRQSHYRLDNWGTEEAVTTSRVHSTTRRFSSRPYWQPISCVFTIGYVSGMRLEIRYLHWEQPETRSQSIWTLSSCHWSRKKKQRNGATSSRRLAATTHRKSRDADSESFRTGSMWQNGGKWTTLHFHWIRHGGKQLYSFMQRILRSPRTSRRTKLQAFLTITSRKGQRQESKYSNLLELWSQKRKYRKFEVLGAYITRNWTARTTINLFSRNWTPKILERCFRRSRRAAGEHRRKVNTRFGQEAAPKPKLILIGFSQRDWKITWARAQHKRDCKFVNISKHVTKMLRHGSCHEADGAVRWTHVLTLMEDAEQTPNWNKKDWIDALSRSTDKSKYGVWWGPTRNEYLYACSTLPMSRG